MLQTSFLPLPKVVAIEPIISCNLRCIMCHVSYEPLSKAKIDIDKTVKFLSKFPPNTHIIFGGAYEPTAHPKFPDLIEGLTDFGFTFEIVTNGTLFTDKLINRLSKVRLKRIQLSFDGATKQTYETIRRRANYDMSLERIKNMRKAFPSNETTISVNNVVMSENLSEMYESVALWDDMGMEEISYLIMSSRFEEDTIKNQSLINREDDVVQEGQALLNKLIAEKKRIIANGSVFSLSKLKTLHEQYLTDYQNIQRDEKFIDPWPTFGNSGYSLARGPEVTGNPDDCAASHRLLHVWGDGTVLLCNSVTIGSIDDDVSALWQGHNANYIRSGVINNSKNCLSCSFRSCVQHVEAANEKESLYFQGGNVKNQNVDFLEYFMGYEIYTWFGDYYAISPEIKQICVEENMLISPLIRFFGPEFGVLDSNNKETLHQIIKSQLT